MMFDTPIKQLEIAYDDRYTIHADVYRTGITKVYIYDDVDFVKRYEEKYICESWQEIENILYDRIMPEIIDRY
jgi:hypothetical protein